MAPPKLSVLWSCAHEFYNEWQFGEASVFWYACVSSGWRRIIVWGSSDKQACQGSSTGLAVCHQPFITRSLSVHKRLFFTTSNAKTVFHIINNLFLKINIHQFCISEILNCRFATVCRTVWSCSRCGSFHLFSLQVLEEWATHTSYDMGLETERAALEQLATHNVHQEQVTSPTDY